MPNTSFHNRPRNILRGVPPSPTPTFVYRTPQGQWIDERGTPILAHTLPRMQRANHNNHLGHPGYIYKGPN